MAAILKVDGYDFYQYVRVAPGEGFDPAGAAFRDPQFSEDATQDSQPLISINERNKEMAWPVHLNAANKDALHTLLADVNRRLANAQQVEWKDESATSSTYLDVVFARFEPDYNFRRAQRNWLSGVLRLWVKPYGHTGTYRLIASSNSSLGFPVVHSISAGSIVGDAPAQLKYIRDDTAYSASFGFRGFSVLGSATAVGFFRSASLSHTNFSASLTAATTAVGSNAVRQFLHGATQTNFLGLLNAENAGPPGRYHIFPIVRAQATSAAATRIIFFGQANIPGPTVIFGPTQTLVPSTNWQVVDLGVFSVGSTNLYNGVDPYIVNGVLLVGGMVGATAGSATVAIDCCGAYLLPEDSTIVSTDNFGTFFGDAIYDEQRAVAAADLTSLGQAIPFSYVFGKQPRLSPASPYRIIAFNHPKDAVQHNINPVSVSAYARERFSYAR